MKNYIIYNDLGKILRTGSCLDGDFLYQAGQDEHILEGLANPDLYYVVDATLVEISAKPSENHFFDYSIKQWVFNYELADSKAKYTRDRLLAEGPDRISPVWWSSMPAAEQEAWTQYRQDLLDITSQPNYPATIVWPTKPS